MSPLFLLGLIGTGAMMLASNRKQDAAKTPDVDAVTGDSGTNWFVETIVTRAQAEAQGIGGPHIKVYDARMKPVVTYIEFGKDGEHNRGVFQTYQATPAQLALAVKDFGLGAISS